MKNDNRSQEIVSQEMNDHQVMDLPKNDCNITTVEAEFDRAMAYKPRCFGTYKADENGSPINKGCARCNWPRECKEAVQ